ncbi:MAG: hypothetical protein ACXVC6_06875 [Bacteroidia bacterium]
MKRVLSILLLGSLFLLVPQSLWAQKKTKKENFKENHNPFGGRKKEKKNQRGTSNAVSKRGGIFKRFSKSSGNADRFAAHSMTGSKGFFQRMFHPNAGMGSPRNASLRKTKPGKVQNKEQSKLFHRLMSNNKGRHERIQKSQRTQRSRNRRRGNEVFPKKKR